MRKRKGVTLIELIVVISLLSVIGTMVVVFIIKGLDIWVFYRDLNAAQANANRAMTKITKEISQANLVSSGSFITDFSQFQFKVSGSGNVAGFKLSTGEAGDLFYYDRDAFFDPLYGTEDPPAGYKGDPNHIFEQAGDKYVKFHLCAVSTVEFQYFGVDSESGTVEAITDSAVFADRTSASAPGPERLVKIYLTSVVKDKSYNLGTIVRIKN